RMSGSAFASSSARCRRRSRSAAPSNTSGANRPSARRLSHSAPRSTPPERRASSAMRRRADLAGLGECGFAFEPVGAAHAADVTSGLTLVFDFGGGTLDLAIVRRQGSALEGLSTAGRNIGGDRCTERLIDDVVAPQLGSRATWTPKRLRLPGFMVNALHDLPGLSALKQEPVLEA